MRLAQQLIGRLLLLALLPSRSVSAAAAATWSDHPIVQVSHSRVRLSDVLAALPEPWASVDLGPAPQPLQKRWFTAKQLQARLQQAQVGPLPLSSLPNGLPPRVQVVRRGQSLSEPVLRSMLQTALHAAMPAGAQLRSLVLPGGVTLPVGAVQVQLPSLQHLYNGRQSLWVTLHGVEDEAATEAFRQSLAVLVDVQLAPQVHTQLIQRGQTVQLVLRQGAIAVHTTAVAQQSGALGERIAVLPTQGNRVVQGRLVDAQTVEVEP